MFCLGECDWHDVYRQEVDRQDVERRGDDPFDVLARGIGGDSSLDLTPPVKRRRTVKRIFEGMTLSSASEVGGRESRLQKFCEMRKRGLRKG